MRQPLGDRRRQRGVRGQPPGQAARLGLLVLPPHVGTGTAARARSGTAMRTSPSIGTGAAMSGLISSIGIGKTMVEFWFDYCLVVD